MTGTAHVLRDPGADLVPVPQLPERPRWAVSLLVDGALGALAYLGSYWLRFEGDELAKFLPYAWSTVGLVAAVQLAALGVSGAYARRPQTGWFLRVIVGIVAGTGIASAIVGVVRGYEGISRSAFGADAMLLIVAALGWRGLWLVRARADTGARSRASDSELVDRNAEMTSMFAVVASLYAYRELLKNLVFKDLKLKYRGSVFGFLWSLLNPLLMIVVYTVAFTFILRIRTAGFVFYLMLGQLSWAFFANSAMMSTGSIVDNGGLLKSVLFPRMILPIGTVLFNFAQYLLTISVFLPAMLIWYRVPLSAPMLLFPVFLALQVVFVIGAALILATWTAFFRDVRHLLEVALAMLFWLTPIVYELRLVPEKARLPILLSPMSPFIVAYQQIFYYREWPAASVYLVATAHAAGTFVVGALVFLAFEDRFTEQL